MHRHKSFHSRVHKTSLIVKHNLMHITFKSGKHKQRESKQSRDIMCKRAAKMINIDITKYRLKRICNKGGIDPKVFNIYE